MNIKSNTLYVFKMYSFLLLEMKFEFTCCTYFPVFDFKTGLLTSPFVKGVVFDMDLVKLMFFGCSKDEQADQWMELSGNHFKTKTC